MKNDKYKFIFIHVPKTGGTSIEEYFGKNMAGKGKHRSLREWCELYEYERGDRLASDRIPCPIVPPSSFDHEFSQYFKFTVVRNPWDRMVSYWKYKKIHSGVGGRFLPFPGLDFAREKSFPKWLNCAADLSQEQWDAFAPIGFATQKQMITHGQICMDYIIRFEDLQNGFDEVCKKIGHQPKPPHRKLPHVHKTNHKHYSAYYNDQTEQFIRERYAEDIKMFDYHFSRKIR